jgi:hypothetical protein
MSPPSPRSKYEPNKKSTESPLYAGFFFVIFFDAENGGDIFLRNVVYFSSEYLAV